MEAMTTTVGRPRLTRRAVCGAAATGAMLGLAACGVGSGTGPQQRGAGGAAGTPSGEVQVLYYTSTEPAIARMNKQEEAINRLLPQIKLTMVPTPTDIDGKFNTLTAGGTPPDISWMGVGFWQHAPANRVMVLDDLVARDTQLNLKEYYPQAVEMFRYKGRTQALAYGVNTHVIAYNKAMLDKAGIKYPTAQWTLSDYLDQAKRLTSAPGVEPQTWGAWIWNMWIAIWMHGGQIFDKDFTRAMIDQPAAVNGLQFYYDQNLGNLKIAPTSGTYHQLFGNGQLAIINVAPFGVPVLRQYQGLEWDLVTMPWTAERKRGTWLSGEGYGIATETKNKDGAWAVLKYLCGREAMADFYAPEFQVIPAARPVAETAFLSALQGKQARPFLESIEFGTPYGGHPVVMKWSEVLNPMWESIRDGKASARDAAREAAPRLNDLLKASTP
ncbi:MAG TPA: extracellular solute-binding protein [Chloroflexota bacterium]|nr:extracellular solute-binding protein [Chloroflexota bacterium]